jgi:hypothetical protein
MPLSVGPRSLRLLVALALGALLALTSASPAGAVPVRPTDMQSTVTGVEPPGPFSVTIIGGDALVDLRVDPGHEVVVDGYDGEPYLRVRADGTVERNRRSPATYLNQSRDAGGPQPADASAKATPDWEQIGAGGRVIWHDHRIHAGDVSGPIDWTIPLHFDGQDATVHGRLRRIASPNPLPWLALAAAVAGSGWYLLRRHPRGGALAAVLIASAMATVTGWLEWASVPAATGRNPGLIALPLGAAGLAVIGTVTARQLRRPTLGLVSTLAAVSLLAGWLAFRWSILTRAVLVSTLAAPLDRATLAVIAGLVVASAGLSVAGAGLGDSLPGVPPGSTVTGPRQEAT